MQSPSQQQWIDQAREFHRAGLLGRAEAIYRELLGRDSTCAEALHGLGLIAFAAGDLGASERLLRAAMEQLPQGADLQVDLAAVLRSAGRIDEAERHAGIATQLAPELSLAWQALGNCATARGNFATAISALRRGADLDPTNAAIHNDLGVAHAALAEHSAAIAAFEQSLRLAPGEARTWHNLAGTWQSQGNAVAAMHALDSALRIQPDMILALHLKARLLRESRDDGAAADSLNELLRRSPSFLPAVSDLAALRADQGMQSEAIRAFRTAVAIAPGDEIAAGNRLVAENYDPQVSLERLWHLHRDAAGPPTGDPHPSGRDSGSTDSLVVLDSSQSLNPRIGYVSADLREHPVGYLLIRDFEGLAARGVWQGVYSNQDARDSLSGRFRAAASTWCDISAMNDEQVVARIAADRIDVLVDLSGLTRGNRRGVFAIRAAPTQVAWLGYPCTTGIPAMDFLLADRWHVPEAHDKWFHERVWPLDTCHSTFEPPAACPEITPLPCESCPAFRVACFHNPWKLNQDWLSTVARIGERRPDAEFHFKYAGFEQKTTQDVVASVFEAHGVERGRLVFEAGNSRRDMLRAYADNDVALDPFPYSGGMTTCESLWMGLPVVTFPGETMASRHAFAYLSAVGLNETIATSKTDYVDRTLELARNRARLAAIRTSLRERMFASQLMNFEEHAEMLWRAFKAMHAIAVSSGK